MGCCSWDASVQKDGEKRDNGRRWSKIVSEKLTSCTDKPFPNNFKVALSDSDPKNNIRTLNVTAKQPIISYGLLIHCTPPFLYVTSCFLLISRLSAIAKGRMKPSNLLKSYHAQPLHENNDVADHNVFAPKYRNRVLRIFN